MSYREFSLKIDNTQIDCVSFGSGDKTLILIPGLALRDLKGSGVFVACMFHRFAKDYTVYCIDKRRELPSDTTIKSLASDYAFAIRELGIEKTDVYGISQGGMIAQQLAIDYPELVGKAVFAVTTSRGNQTIEKFINTIIEKAQAGDFEGMSLSYFESVYSEKYRKKFGKVLQLMAKRVRPSNPDRFISLARACLGCDTYGELDKITCPVFVIGGKKDTVVSPEASYEMAEKLNCPVYMYDDYGHSAYEEASDFNDRVLDFLNK